MLGKTLRTVAADSSPGVCSYAFRYVPESPDAFPFRRNPGGRSANDADLLEESPVRRSR